MIEIIHTLQMKLDIPLDIVKRTIQAFLDACNYSSAVSFANGGISNSIYLHHLTYTLVRAQFKLSSQISCNAIRHVASKYAALRTQKQYPRRPIVFSRFSMSLQLKYDFSYQVAGMSLWTIEGRRKRIPFTIGKYFAKYQDWTLGGGTLYIKRGKVYLAQSISKRIPEISNTGNVLGVDKGVNYIATITDGSTFRFLEVDKQNRFAAPTAKDGLLSKRKRHSTTHARLRKCCNGCRVERVVSRNTSIMSSASK
jgi:transposase